MKMETMHAPAGLVLLLLAAACGAPGKDAVTAQRSVFR